MTHLKTNKLKIKFVQWILLLIIFSFTVTAASWLKGDLHIHTGYSTQAGYDGNPSTDEDDCPDELFTWVKGEIGRNITQLKEDAIGFGLSWQSFTDHSYCLDSSEFDRVKTDCDNAKSASYTCLAGEELSVHRRFSGTTLCSNKNLESVLL